MSYQCPDCQQPLEEIKACGCRDLFCNHCGQLVSRKRAVTTVQEVNEVALAAQDEPVA